MNQFNNDTLPFQNKIVGIIIPDDIETLEKAVEIIAKAFHCIYGIIVAIFGKHIHYISMSPLVTPQTMLVAQRFINYEDIETHLDIIPFPK